MNFSGPKAPDGLWVGQIYYPKVLLVAFTVVNENDKMPRLQPQCRSHTVIDARATIGPPMEDQTERVQRSCH